MLSKKDIQFINQVRNSETLLTIIHKRKMNLEALQRKNNKFLEENYMEIINRIIRFSDAKKDVSGMQKQIAADLENTVELNSRLLNLMNEKVDIETTNLKITNILTILKKLKGIYFTSKKIERGDFYRKITNIEKLKKEIEVFRNFRFYGFLKELIEKYILKIFAKTEKLLSDFLTEIKNSYENLGVLFLQKKKQEQKSVLISEKFYLRDKIDFSPLLISLYVHKKFHKKNLLYKNFNLQREKFFDEIMKKTGRKKLSDFIAYFLIEYFLIDLHIQFDLQNFYEKLLENYLSGILCEKMDESFDDLHKFYAFIDKYFNRLRKSYLNLLINLFFNFIEGITFDEKLIMKIKKFTYKLSIREFDEIFFKKVNNLIEEEYEKNKISKEDIILLNKNFFRNFSIIEKIDKADSQRENQLVEKYIQCGKSVNYAKDFKFYTQEIKTLKEKRRVGDLIFSKYIKSVAENFNGDEKEIAKIIVYMRENFPEGEKIFLENRKI